MAVILFCLFYFYVVLILLNTFNTLTYNPTYCIRQYLLYVKLTDLNKLAFDVELNYSVSDEN